MQATRSMVIRHVVTGNNSVRDADRNSNLDVTQMPHLDSDRQIPDRNGYIWRAGKSRQENLGQAVANIKEFVTNSQKV